jgi:hypothetical protein
VGHWKISIAGSENAKGVQWKVGVELEVSTRITRPLKSTTRL